MADQELRQRRIGQETLTARKNQRNERIYKIEKQAEPSSGSSIKKAQQSSAELALQCTKLPHPPEKPARKKNNYATRPHRVLQNVCRTLQYPAPRYISCNPPVYPDPGCPVPEHILLPPTAVAMYGTPFSPLPIDPLRPYGPKLQAVIVNINGKSIATGLGETYPLAKQDAASKALTVLSPKLMEHKTAREQPIQEIIPLHKQKSVISDIHEKAYQLKLNVVFEVLKEEGPPHDRVYAVRCAFVTSTDIVLAEATGKGRKKKTAQQEACTKLLKNIETLTVEDNPVVLASHACKTQKKLTAVNRESKRKTIVKDKKMNPDYGHQINPVSRLMQITQARNEIHPTFELVAEHGLSKYKEFIIRVQCGKEVQEGKGPNKRLAKRAAAEAMLQTIGYVKPLPSPGKSLLKKNQENSTEDICWEPVEFTLQSCDSTEQKSETDSSFSNPKILVKSEMSSENEKRRVTFNTEVHACPPPGDENYPNSIVTELKKEVFVEGRIRRLKRAKEHRRSLTEEQTQELSKRSQTVVDVIRNKESTAYSELDGLSVAFKFSVQYTTFPEASPSQHFTIVSLGLDEPMVGHGIGSTVNEANEEAAFAALLKLKYLIFTKK
uniref:DRBM domain-containing protein n=1 Tax=Caenorhabditis japonica TaxID=281687 RepID=A0A8R1DFP2_CAEJA